MEYKRLNDVQIPMVGLGTYTLHGRDLYHVLDEYGTSDIMLIDTAFKYQNETEIGQYLQDNHIQREKVVLQTKLSVVEQNPIKIMGIPMFRKSPRQTLMGGGKRLCVNKVDIYLLHSPSNGYEKRYAAIAKLRNKGLVTLTGVCSFNIKQLADIYNICGEYPQINQIELHPYYSNKNVIDFSKEHNIQLEARSPFAHGDVMEEWMANPILTDIAHDHHKTVPQIILRWIVQQDIIALPRSKNPQHVKENINIFDFTLDETQMRKIDSLNRDQSFGYKSQRLRE